jgi:adenylylsulfate kinase
VFAVWLTGLPAAGKSTIARALAAELTTRGIRPAVLESDALRAIFTPQPTYSEEERDTFYGSLAFVGSLLFEHGVPVILDATANRRRHRDRARATIPRFIEVLVECPLPTARGKERQHAPGSRDRLRATTAPGTGRPRS